MKMTNLRAAARSVARNGLLTAIRTVTGRTPVLLSPAAGIVPLLDARAPYRVPGNQIEIEVRPERPGVLSVQVVGDVSQGPAPVLGTFAPVSIAGPVSLSFLIDSGTLGCGEREIGRIAGFAAPRRFAIDLMLRTGRGEVAERRLGHYRPGLVDAAGYYTGAHYRDYDAQAMGDVQRTMEQLRQWGATGPLLEIGCATGVLLEACAHAGLDATGVDVSDWAVEKARARAAVRDVVCADIDQDRLPASLHGRRFRTVVLNAVLEHVAKPERLLRHAASLVESGGLLFLTTANANSLTRLLFGDDWEGLADPTHKSVELITPDALRGWLVDCGWRVEQLSTHSVWDDNPDPVHASLRDAAAYDARFRQLLVQCERGDFLECVARRMAA